MQWVEVCCNGTYTLMFQWKAKAVCCEGRKGKDDGTWQAGGGDKGRNTYEGLWLHLLKKHVNWVVGMNREDEYRRRQSFTRAWPTMQLVFNKTMLWKPFQSNKKPRFTKFVAYLYSCKFYSSCVLFMLFNILSVIYHLSRYLPVLNCYIPT
jgi:hypothetical protein